MLLFLFVIAALFVLSIVYFNYLGFLNPVKIDIKRIPRSLFLYSEYIGNYRKIGPSFMNIHQNVKPKFKAADRPCGIYYDDPATLEDRETSRAVCGLLIDDDEKEKAQNFIKENAGWKLKELPELECVSSAFPFKSKLSVLFVVIKVYPQIKEYAFRNRVVKIPSDVKGMLEIYSCDGEKQIIEVLLPYGKGTDEICLSSQAAPQQRGYDVKKES